ncbi:hypothetical protein GBAR_LOCUS27011 [Geodia barretti]|uniref:Uncharacterized protein n=1 Tax=Geodia barretti TaxID=519541 RepID=A0AA35X887_GEOBA|nr:hypothetical protein GBAR_LOCUS27011 [Geodia barretti]
MGFVELSEETRGQLAEYVRSGGNVDWANYTAAATRVGETMALISATTRVPVRLIPSHIERSASHNPVQPA